MNTMKTFCQQCHMKCPVVVEINDGRIERVKNTNCQKGRFVPELIYHPDRVTRPLQRTGAKGGGNWREIAWDEAFELMASSFSEIRDTHGSEAIATISGCYHKENALAATFLFSYLLGTPNVLDANHLCIIPDVIGQIVTMGEMNHSDPLVDYKRSKCILIWGANPAETRPPQAASIFKAREKGAKLIVVDPRPTATASRADLWLRIRPGTDAALALGMIDVIIREEIYDRDFMENWCVGFEALQGRAREYPVEKTAEITGLPAADIVEAARMFATIKPACLHTRLGSGAQHINSTQTSRAITILMALIGCVDVPGGNLLGDLTGGFKRVGMMPRLLRLPPEIQGKRIGAEEYPLTAGANAPFIGRAHTPSAVKAMLNGDIKAFYVPGSNFVINESNSREVWEALKNLDFMVAVDFFRTPTAELADLILPAAHWLETDTPLDAWQEMGPHLFNYVMGAQKVIEPEGECSDDRKIVFDLAKTMGLNTPWGDISEFNDWRLEETGYTFSGLIDQPDHMISFPVSYRKYEQRNFRTPSGKVELSSSILEAAGHDPLPSHIEPPESPVSTPGLFEQYPLILTTYRHRAYEHTEYRQIESLRRLLPEPYLEIHPQTATDYGIAEGDNIRVETPHLDTHVTAKARFVPELHPSVVAMLFGWWFPEKEGPEHGCFESNVNTIIFNGPPYEPFNGNYQARGVLCKVSPA